MRVRLVFTLNLCCLDQVERVEELVTSGEGDVSYMDNEKRSPLHAAAFVGNSDIVEILIEQVLMTRILCPVLNAQTVFG